MTDNELLDRLAEHEYRQWCYWSKGLSEDYFKLIKIALKYDLIKEDEDFVISQLDRLKRWQHLWDSNYKDLPDEIKTVDYHCAKIVLAEVDDEIQKLTTILEYETRMHNKWKREALANAKLIEDNMDVIMND